MIWQIATPSKQLIVTVVAIDIKSLLKTRVNELTKPDQSPFTFALLQGESTIAQLPSTDYDYRFCYGHLTDKVQKLGIHLPLKILSQVAVHTVL